MATINDVELPSGEGGMNPILFAPEDSIPFDNEPMSLYEEETQRAQQDMLGQYREPMPDVIGIGDSDTTTEEPSTEPTTSYELPKQFAQQPKEKSIIEQYNENLLAVKEAERQAQVTAQRATELAVRDYKERRKEFDLSLLEQTKEILYIQEKKEEAYQEKFGWLNEQPYPTYSEFVSNFYPEYDELDNRKKVEIYDYWGKKATEYFSGFNGMKPEEVATGLNKVLIESPELVEAKKANILEDFKNTGYNIPDMADVLLDVGDLGFDVTRSNIAVANTMKDAQKKFAAWDEIVQKYPNVFNPDGTFNQEAYTQARTTEEQQGTTPVSIEGIGATYLQTFTVPVNRELTPFGILGENPISTLSQVVDAQRLLGEYSMYQATVAGSSDEAKAARELMESLGGLRRVTDPLTGEVKEEPMTPSQQAWGVLSNFGKAAGFLTGMFAAQQADLLEENLAGLAITSVGMMLQGRGAGLAGRLAGRGAGLSGTAIMTTAAGEQEARLVAVDVFKEVMTKAGYDLGNFNDWERARRNGVLATGIEYANEKGALKGYTTAAVSAGIDKIVDLGIKNVPFFGGVGASYGMARRFATRMLGSGIGEGTGELAGQAAAGFQLDLGDAAVESILGSMSGTAMQVGTETWQRTFGKKADPATQGQPPPAAGAAPGGSGAGPMPTGPTPTRPTPPAGAPVVPTRKTPEQKVADLENEILGQEPPDTAAAAPEETASDATVQFTTERGGSVYTVYNDGTTSRVKGKSGGVHEGDFGPKPRSSKTVYVTPEAAGYISIIYTEAPIGGRRSSAKITNEGVKVTWNGGRDKNGNVIQKEKTYPFSTEPAVGLHPFEVWGDGVHLGSKINKLFTPPPVEGKSPAIKTAPADANATRQPSTALAIIPPLAETPATAPNQPRVALPRGEGVSSMADLGIPMGDVMTDFGPLRTEPTPTVEPLTVEAPPAQPELAMPTVLSPREQAEANLIAQLSPAERRLRIAENLKKTFPDTYDLIERIEQARTDSDVKEDDPFGIEEVNALIDLAIRIDEEIKSQQQKAAVKPQRMPTVEDIATSPAKAKRNVDLEGFRNRVRAEAAAQAEQPVPEGATQSLSTEVLSEDQNLLKSFIDETKNENKYGKFRISAKALAKLPKQIAEDLSDWANEWKNTGTKSVSAFAVDTESVFIRSDTDYTAWNPKTKEFATLQSMGEMRGREADILPGQRMPLPQGMVVVEHGYDGSGKPKYTIHYNGTKLTEQSNQEQTALQITDAQEQQPVPAPTPMPTPEGEVALTPQELSDSFREEQKTLPEKSQAAWTEQDYATADQYFQTGDEALLEGLNKVKQNRIRSHRFFVAEDRRKEAQARRSQGGFIDIAGIGQGITETAIKLWNGTKNFAEWSGQMIENYGQRISQYLRDIWNRINGLAKTAKQYLPSQQQRPAEPGARRFSTPTEKDIKKAFAEAAEQSAAETQSRVQTFFGGRTPDNVGFINDIMLPFTASISGLKNGRPFVTVNLAYANPQNIEGALYEEIGHYAAEKGMMKNFYDSLDPTEKADVDAAVAAYGESEARQADLSVDALRAEEREAKSFAAIATRNKNLWQRIKELVNRILTDLGLSKASTDQQVADIFLKAMNAFKNDTGNNIDATNRRIYYSRTATKEKFSKLAAKIDKSKDGHLRHFVDSINIRYLDKTERQLFVKFLKDLANERSGKEVADINIDRSKDWFDRAMEGLRQFKDLSWNNEFDKLKQQYPSSLEGIDSSYFPRKDRKEVLGYISNLGTPEGNELAGQQNKAAAKRAERSAERAAQKEADKLKAIDNALKAQKTIPGILQTAPYKDLSLENKVYVLQALKYLQQINPNEQSQRQNEQLVALVNGAIEGEIIGYGKYSILYSLNEFSRKLNDLKAKYGGKLPFGVNDYKALQKIQNAAEAYVIKGQSLFKKETINRILFTSPEIKELWDETFGDYLDLVQTKSSALQNTLNKEMERILEENKLTRRTYVGSFKEKNKDLFNTDVEKQKEEIMYVSMMTQWNLSSEDPIADIENVLADLIKGNDAMVEYGTFMTGKGKSNQKTLSDLLAPAVRDGLLVQAADGQFSIKATPEVWSDYMFNVLKPNQQKALTELRGLSNLLQGNLKFTKEFWYGETFDPVVNYTPRVAQMVTPTNPEGGGPDLNSTNYVPDRSTPEVTTHGSVLHGRKRLGSYQYYNTSLEAAMSHAFNSAAYEVSTAPARMKIHEILREHNDRESNERFLDFFGPDFNTAVQRRALVRESYKAVHKAELKRDIAEKAPKTAAGLFASSILEDASSYIFNMMLGTVKNYPAQYAAPFVAGVAFAGKRIFEANAQIDSWPKEQMQKFFRDNIPDLMNRAEISNLLLDTSMNTSVIDKMASIDLNGNLDTLSPYEARLIKLARGKQVASSVVGTIPKTITKTVTATSDATAASRIFPGLLLNRLIENGIIKKADELTPQLMQDTRVAPSLAQAKVDLSDMTGVPGRYSLRGTAFVDKSNFSRNMIIKTIFGLMQITANMAGDTVVAIKDLSYVNSKDPYAAQIREEGRKRLRSMLAQNATFLAVGTLAMYVVSNALFYSLSKVEDLDEEEQRMVDNMRNLKANLKVQGSRGVKEFFYNSILMMFGPVAANSVFDGFADTQTRMLLKSVFEEEYKAEQERLDKAIKKSKNESEKADLRLKKAENQEIWKEVNTFFGTEKLGPIVSEVEKLASSRYRYDDLEYDRIAQRYYEAGGKISKPDRNELLGFVRKGLGFVSADMRRSSRQISQAREAVAKIRETQLKQMEKRGAKKVRSINIPTIGE